jgi:hypothetical protein
MCKVEFNCDRCGKTVEGLQTEEGTAGFYQMEGMWAEFKQNDSEKRVCDDCMWKDPKYRERYGYHGGE